MSQSTNKDADERVKAVKSEIRNKKSESTASRYIQGIDGFIDWLVKRDIDPFNSVSKDFRTHMNSLIDDGYAIGTLQPRLVGIRLFYQTAQELHKQQNELREAGREVRGPEIPDVNDPTDGISFGDFNIDRRSKQAKELEAADKHHKLSQEQIDELVENVPSPTLRNALIIRLLYQCCLRRSELVYLKVDDVNRDERTIDVPAVKGNKGRDTPIPYRATLDDILNVWLEVERKGVAKAADSEYLFPTTRSERLNEDSVSKIVRKAAQNAGLQETLYVNTAGHKRTKIHSHTLRASGAHRFWKNSDDIYLVSKILGHSDVNTTETYLDVDKEDIISKAKENW